MAKWLVVALVIAAVWQYARWTWKKPLWARAIIYGWTGKPFVYRALVPFLAQVLVWLGVEPGMALQVLVTLSGVGLLMGMWFLMRSVRDA